jgi:chromatin remodeling complex protein RSC6
MAKKKSALDIEYVLSDELSELLGSETATRAEVTKAIWDYIKENDLQDSKDKRVICPDATLASVVGKAKFNMMKLAGKLSPHFVEKA